MWSWLLVEYNNVEVDPVALPQLTYLESHQSTVQSAPAMDDDCVEAKCILVVIVMRSTPLNETL